MRWTRLRAAGLVSAVLAALVSSPAAALVTCQLDADDAFTEARNANFAFKMVATDATSCTLSRTTIVIAAPQERDVFCRFAVLADEKPLNGWQLVRLKYSPSDQADVTVTSLQPGWLFDIRAPRARTSLVSIQKVVARGTRCRDWKNAFAAAREEGPSDQ